MSNGENKAGGAVQLLRCQCGGQTYCLDMNRVRSIQRGSRLRPDPDEKGRLGWLGNRNDKIPIYSLAARLTQQKPASIGHSSILVLDHKTHPFALGVD